VRTRHWLDLDFPRTTHTPEVIQTGVFMGLRPAKKDENVTRQQLWVPHISRSEMWEERLLSQRLPGTLSTEYQLLFGPPKVMKNGNRCIFFGLQ
jgi:hypothetical protein